MVNFNILRGLSTKLPSAKVDGNVYFCTDTGDVYFDFLDIAGTVQRTRINIDDLEDLQGQINTKLSKSGGTMTGNITLDNDASSQSGEPYIQWANRSNNKPYTGFAHDQTDGTFIICSMEKDTTTNGVKHYKNGLAIGGGSGNLFWKGVKLTTTDDVQNAINSESAYIISSTQPPIEGNQGRYWHDAANGYILYLNTGTKWELVPSTWG